MPEVTFLGDDCCCGGCASMAGAVTCGLARVTGRTVDGAAAPDFQYPMAWGSGGFGGVACGQIFAVDGPACNLTQAGERTGDYSGCGKGYWESFLLRCLPGNDRPQLTITVGVYPNEQTVIVQTTSTGPGLIGADVTYTVTEDLLTGPVDHVISYHVDFLPVPCPADKGCFTAGEPPIAFDPANFYFPCEPNRVFIQFLLTCAAYGSASPFLFQGYLYWNPDINAWVPNSSDGTFVGIDTGNGGPFVPILWKPKLTCDGTLTVDVYEGRDPAKPLLCHFAVTIPRGTGLPTNLPITCTSGSCSGGTITITVPPPGPTLCFENFKIRITNPLSFMNKVDLHQLGTSSMYTGKGFLYFRPPFGPASDKPYTVDVSFNLGDDSIFLLMTDPDSGLNVAIMNEFPSSVVAGPPLVVTYPGESFTSVSPLLTNYAFVVAPGAIVTYCTQLGL